MEAYDLSDTSSNLSSPPMSPVPPSEFYPSPPTSQGLGIIPPIVSEPPMQPTPGPPTSTNKNTNNRRRRAVPPKPRISRHLDLGLVSHKDQNDHLELLVSALQNKRKIVVVAGAGISVSAGIPDFRSSHGLFKTLRKDHKLKASGKELFDASVYLDSTMTSSFHDMVRLLSDMAATAKPSAFHHLLARLAKEDRLLRLYTQNIDGIDTSLPPLTTEVPLNLKAPWPRTIQLHGVRAQREPGRWESYDLEFVLYNEHNPDEEAIGSVVRADLRTRPDALVVVGTSLKNPRGSAVSLKEMCRVVQGRKDGITMWINHDSAPVGRDFEHCWDLVVQGDCDEVAELVGLKRWNDTGDETFAAFSAPEAESFKQGHGNNIAVVVPRSIAMAPKARTHITPVEMPANPATKYHPLKKPLDGKAEKPPRQRRTPHTNKSPPQRKLPSNFRVSKPSNQGEKNNVKNIFPDMQVSTIMHPISPGAARNNGPMFPELVASSTSHPPATTPWNDTEIISPIGRIPADMQKILISRTNE
ncbi:Sir2 family histone deacetylase Hst4 [Coccidioides immitis H538.4]|uniref:Sir2 family histone deacetylase Hst4 n=1 Tax=Coccidioides immitis H538.4 TaxID=396776 RepID=A0A0J8RTP4_COCIT|nr:Sir2 family histone deacetylase Hst4 [Coccidioides immitis H538.4]